MVTSQSTHAPVKLDTDLLDRLEVCLCTEVWRELCSSATRNDAVCTQ